MNHATPPATPNPVFVTGTMVPVEANPLPGFGEARLIAISPRLA